MGILLAFFQYLIRRKFRSKWGGMLFSNTKRTNLKVLVSPISDLWKRYQMPVGHEQIIKKARPSRDSVLEVWSAKVS